MEKQEKLLSLLKEKLTELDNLEQNYSQDNIQQWKNEVLMILENLISADSDYYKQFKHLSFRSHVFSMMDSHRNDILNREAYKRDIDSAKGKVNSIIFGVENGLLK
jgi:hypothetical protein